MTDSRNIYELFLEAQKLIKNPKKDARNPHFKNTYATLTSVVDEIKEVLLALGIAHYQTCSIRDGVMTVRTVLFTPSRPGDPLVFDTAVPVKDLTPQGGMGSFTYGRRYGWLAAFNLTADDDDDGNIHVPVVVQNAPVKTDVKPGVLTASQVLLGKK